MYIDLYIFYCKLLNVFHSTHHRLNYDQYISVYYIYLYYDRNDKLPVFIFFADILINGSFSSSNNFPLIYNYFSYFTFSSQGTSRLKYFSINFSL